MVRNASGIRGVLLLCGLVPVGALAQQQSGPAVLPAGTQLPVRTMRRLAMKVGTPVRAELMYPVYADNRLILPAKTVVAGEVVALKPDHARRIAGRLRADFTPFHTAGVRFDAIVPPDGAAIPIVTSEATEGAPLYRLVPTPAPKGGILGQYFELGLGYVRDSINAVVGPDKGYRLWEFLSNQLPYHPERIAQDTAWTVETAAPVEVMPVAAVAAPPPAARPGWVGRFLHPPAATAPATADPGAWRVEAYLDEAISSKTSRVGQAISATVATPVLRADGSIAVPQGAKLEGTVTQAKPARRFARAGVLRFDFSALKLPDAPAMQVRTTLEAADSTSERQLAMDSEGQVKPKAQDKILVPLLLVVLASQPFDRDHGEHQAGKSAVASGSLGLISLIVGTASQQPNVAIGLGFYSAALSIYPRYFGRGGEVTFPRDTRIVVQTAATARQQLRPEAKP